MTGKKFSPNTPTAASHEATAVTPEKPVKFKQATTLWSFSKPRHPFRFFMAFVLLFVLTLLLTVAGVGYWYAHNFSQSAGVSIGYLREKVEVGVAVNPFERQDAKHFLILGLDEIKSQREGSLLTDTILIARVTANGKASLLSIPRDLWIDSLKTKVNSLYYYGEESTTTTGKDLVKTVISDITGIPIDHTVVISLESVARLIDIIGGIEVSVPSTFRDEHFPRSDVDVAVVKDPLLLYETVEFEKGIQHFDGNRAMKYVRSRYSDDANEGNDGARNQRQQLVAQAIVARIASWEILSNPTTTGSLYRLWREDIQTDMTEEEIIGLAKALSNQNLTFHPVQLPIADTASEGILIHPPIRKYQLWVYEPTDPSWLSLKNWVRENFTR